MSSAQGPAVRSPLQAAGAAVCLAAASPALAEVRAGGDPHAWRDAAVVAAVESALLGADDDVVQALGRCYGALLLSVPVERAGGVALAAAGIAERRRRGGFSTPPQLAAALAAHTLDRLPLGPDGVPAVVDPACGPGALLAAAFDRLLELGLPPGAALSGLHGVDADPSAVAVCRAFLAVRARAAGLDRSAGELAEQLAARIVVGDALLGAAPLCPGDGLVFHQAFPAVLDRPGAQAEPVTGWRGGFDAVLANPPWERMKVTRKDWAGAPPPHLRADWAAGARSLRDAGRHPLTGAGELNAYLPFVETCWRLLGPNGRAGVLVPAGVAADRSSSALLRALLGAGALELMYLLDPPAPIFEGVSRRVGIAMLVLRSGPHQVQPSATARVAVGVADPATVEPDRCWTLDAATLRLVNPNSSTAPLFGSARDAEIVTAAHRRHPVLRRRDAVGGLIDDPWQLRLVTPLHMTRDARFFTARPGSGLLPLWEAKHAGLLDHRGGGTASHRYWVPESLMHERYGELTARGWLAGYRNVTTVDSPRTLVPTALPVAGVGNSLPLLSAPRLPLLLAALASLPVDHLVRQKHAGANLNFFKLEQVPLPPPAAYDVPAPWAPGITIGQWVLERFAAAVAWDESLAGLAGELVACGVVLPAVATGPRHPAVADAATRRALALADLDAVHAVLLGLGRDDLEHVLSTFTALRSRQERLLGRFVTADRVLAAYDTLTSA
ncbi:MAG TPA: hypothetical protein VHN80_04240 [Kineosporiaceae bacterium]|nr:hypothetical protein [Kineosporiaceae bacterium]